MKSGNNNLVIIYNLSKSDIFLKPNSFTNFVTTRWSLWILWSKIFWEKSCLSLLVKLLRNLRKSIEEERKSRRIMEEKISSWNAWSPRNRAKPKFFTKFKWSKLENSDSVNVLTHESSSFDFAFFGMDKI